VGGSGARECAIGNTIQVTVTGCARFAYRDFDVGVFTTDLPTIASMEPEVLSAELRGDLSEIDCASGVLEVIATDRSLALDSGRSIRLQELLDVAEAYWTEFDERVKKARQESS